MEQIRVSVQGARLGVRWLGRAVAVSVGMSVGGCSLWV
jgi:hypothetical protein